MSWQIQQSIHFRDCDLFRASGDFCDLIACTNFSFPQQAKVEPWPVMCDEQSRHARLIHTDADAVASHTWLCHFEFGFTNAVSITNTHLVIGKSVNREVLSELTENKVIASQKTLPVTV